MSPRHEGAAQAAPTPLTNEEAPDPRAPLPADPGAEASVADGPGAESPAADGPGADAPTLGDPETEADAEGGQEHEGLLAGDLEELTGRAEKADEYLDLAQRTKADFENYRKRAEKKVAEAQERGVTKLAMELLPAIDNLDRALQASEAFAIGSPEESAAALESQLASGIKLVHADVLAALARVGIEPFSPAGEQFDPQVHEAVAQHPVDGAQSGTVLEVYQQGYRLGTMVLRPARVLVAA